LPKIPEGTQWAHFLRNHDAPTQFPSTTEALAQYACVILSDIGANTLLLHPDVCDGSHEGLLSVYSLSKQSNLAGYRAAFVAGDVRLIRELLEVRKHAGMMVPWPVQRAVLAALSDASHVAEQKARYAARRAVLLPAVEQFGLRIDDSEAGLYLWATAGEPGRVTVERLADRGILVAPGDFYGHAGYEHVRIALTATDERVAAAAQRLARPHEV